MPASEVGDQSRAEAAEAMATGRAARRERDGEQAGAEEAGDSAAAADARSELEHAEAAQAREEAEDGAAGAAAQAGHAAGGEQADAEQAGEQVEGDVANAPRGRDEEPDAAEPAEALLCPLTLSVMTDPVVIADGRTYERAAIKRHLADHNTSPLTNLPLENKMILVNWFARNMIEQAGHPLVANPVQREDLSPPSAGAPAAPAAAAPVYTCRMEGTLISVGSAEWHFRGEWWSTEDTAQRMRFEYKVSVPLNSFVSMMFQMAGRRRLQGPRRPFLHFSGHYDLPERETLGLMHSETTLVRRVKDDFTLSMGGGLHHSDPNPEARRPFLADPECLFFAGNHPSGRYVNRATLQASAPTIEGEAYQFTLRVFRQYARGLRNEGQPQLDRAARPRFAVRPEDGERATMRAMMRRMVNETAAMQNRQG